MAKIIERDRLNPFLGNRNTMADLLGIVGDALKMSPPLYIDSILGHPWTWLPPHRSYSEFSIISPWNLVRTVKYPIESRSPAPGEGGNDNAPLPIPRRRDSRKARRKP